MNKRMAKSRTLIAFVALMSGVFLSYVVWGGKSVAIEADSSVSPVAAETAKTAGSLLVPGKFSPISFKPPAKGKMIGIDLSNKEVTLFTNGSVRRTMLLQSVGQSGSAWETPVGNYTVLNKERRHYSPIAERTMPWAVHFFGNSFLHGPIEQSAKQSKADVSTAALGSLKLAEDDARSVFEFAELGTQVTVLSGTGMSYDSHLALAVLGDVSAEFLTSQAKLQPISARAYIVQDLDSGAVLLSKNADERMPIASVSKLMTQVIADDLLVPTELTTVSPRAASTFGAAGAFRTGEQLPIADVSYALLLESSNAAAEVLAEAAGRERFIAAMNAKAKSLQMQATHYEDPSGLDSRNVSSAADLVRLSAYLVKNKPELLQITRAKAYSTGKTASSPHRWVNHNRLVIGKNSHYIGGKTGYIPEAGQTSVALFTFPISEFSEKRVAIVLLRSYNRDMDTRAILRYLQSGLFYDTGVPVNDDDLVRTRLTDTTVKTPEVASLVAVGNIQADTSLEKVLQKQSISPSGIFKNSYFIKSASFAFGNLQGAVTGPGYQVATTESPRTSREMLDTLAETGFDALLVSNKYSGDWGRPGLSHTLDWFSKAKMVALGAGVDGKDALLMREHDVNGVKFGFIGSTLNGPAWLSEYENLPVITSARDMRIGRAVAEAAPQVDHVVVAISYDDSQYVEFRATARNLITAGAHVVIGYGPRKVHPIERYRNGVIASSLGDFIAPATVLPSSDKSANQDGLVLQLVFNKKEVLTVNAEHVVQNEKYEPILVDTEE